MNNELTTVNINKTDITVKEYQGKRVVTLKEIDLCHERPEGTARRTFNANKQHLIEGVDYFVRNPSDVQMNEFRTSEINNRGTTLIRETSWQDVRNDTGGAQYAESQNDDKSRSDAI